MLEGARPDDAADDWQVKELIKQHLFRKGVDEEKIVVLIIDEGQKIPAFCLEILREFLNYETNAFKLLQIVIFAQKELAQSLDLYPNFSDRINLTHPLGPMNFADTRAMIRFRLDQSGRNSAGSTLLFTFAALWAVYRQTGGYPRRIIHLCHRCLLTAIIQNRFRIDWFTVRSCAKRDTAAAGRTDRRLAFAVVAAFLLVCVAAVLSTENARRLVFGKNKVTVSVALQPKAIQPAPTPAENPQPPVELKQPKGPDPATPQVIPPSPIAKNPAGFQAADAPADRHPAAEDEENLYEMPAMLWRRDARTK